MEDLASDRPLMTPCQTHRALFSGIKAKHCGKSNPIGVLAVDVAAVDEIHAEFVDRTPAQPDLKTRLGHADGFLSCAHLAEDLGGERPNIVGGAPVDSGAIGCIVLFCHTVPLPTSIQVDAHDSRYPQRRWNSDKNGGGFLVREIVDNRP